MTIRIETGLYGYLDATGRYRTAHSGDEIDLDEAEAERLISLRLASRGPGPGSGQTEDGPGGARRQEAGSGEEEQSGAESAPAAETAGGSVETAKPEKKVPLSKLKVAELRKRCEEAGAWGCERWTRDECIGFLTEAEAGDDIPAGADEDIIV